MEPAPVSIADAVSNELKGERVLWAASPNRWAYASRYWKTAVFGIPFAAFAIFWTYQVSHIPAKGDQSFSFFGFLWGLMFVGFGLSMLLSPLWAAWTATNVYYVVTDRRAVIFEKPFRLKIQSFPPSAVATYERVSNGGLGGNIIFQRISEGSGRGTRIREIGFVGVKEYASAVRALDELVSRGVAA